MLSVTGSLQRGCSLRICEYVAQSDVLAVELADSAAGHAPYLYWFAGAQFPQSYLKVKVSASSGLFCGLSLIRADTPAAYNDAMDSCRVRIPGVPVCDLTGWPRDSVQRMSKDFREYVPIGVASRNDTVQILILEADAPVIVYSSGDIDIGVDQHWNLAVVQARHLPDAHVRAVMAAGQR